MNRRGFLNSVLKAGVAAAILPSALTYQRNWKVVEIGGPMIHPNWLTQEYKVLRFIRLNEYGLWEQVHTLDLINR